MRDIWFVSDTHWAHDNVLTFTTNNGKLIRPEFSCIEEMNEVMIENWNKVIKPGDKVYHLGDVVMKMEAVHSILPFLHGSKRLVLGNHDAPFLQHMMKYFKKVMLWRIFKDEGFVCSHIPLMPEQFRHKVTHNVHGHLHQNKVMSYKTYDSGIGEVDILEEDSQYINVCVEHTNYTPIHMDEILQRIKNGLTSQENC